MNLLDGPDFYGFTVFCDDIRHEVGGKQTYVGSYGVNLFVHGDFPLMLPKFGFGVHYIQRHRLFIPPSRIVIFLPGDTDDQPSIEAVAPVPPDSSATLDWGRDNEHGVITMIAGLVFGPLEIKEPGFIRVRVGRGPDLVRAGALRVEKAPPQESLAS